MMPRLPSSRSPAAARAVPAVAAAVDFVRHVTLAHVPPAAPTPRR